MSKEDKNKKPLKQGDMDHPEQYKTEKESLFDKYESQKNVDPIPIEELNEKVKDEKNKEHSKDTSSSEKKYPN